MSGGLIPQKKADKFDCGDGVVLAGTFAAGTQKSLDKFVTDFEAMVVKRQSAEAKGQMEIDFSGGVTFVAAALRADKPKMKVREYSICIEMKDLSFEDRSKIHAMAQDGSKDIHISIVQKEKRSYKLDSSKKDDADPKADEAKTDTPADPPAAETTTETRMVDHSTDKLNLPAFQNDTLEERLQAALLIREGSADRWADRINAGMKDADLAKAIDSEWKDEEYKASSEGRHFVVKPGNTPKFWLAERVGVPANMLSKPTLTGAKLLAKAREVLGFEAPSPKTTKGKSKAKK